jgi:hypothetical protein
MHDSFWVQGVWSSFGFLDIQELNSAKDFCLFMLLFMLILLPIQGGFAKYLLTTPATMTILGHASTIGCIELFGGLPSPE